jgi:hypothetical protein
MKQTVTVPTVTLTLEEVLLKPHPNVGFDLEDGDKVILIPSDLDSKFYFARAISSWATGENLRPYGSSTMIISEWAKHFSSLSAQMYFFDTSKEVLQWFAE